MNDIDMQKRDKKFKTKDTYVFNSTAETFLLEKGKKSYIFAGHVETSYCSINYLSYIYNQRYEIFGRENRLKKANLLLKYSSIVNSKEMFRMAPENMLDDCHHFLSSPLPY